MEHFTIDYKNFLAGISTADGKEDGGYSPLYGGHNIQEENDGYIYPQHAVSYTRWLTDPDYAPVVYQKSPLYGKTASSIFGVLIDANNRVYGHETINDINYETTPAFMDFAEYGNESPVFFKGDAYIGGDSDVCQVDFDSNGVLPATNITDSDWWTNTRGHGALTGFKTALVVVEDTMYIVNGNSVHTWDGSSSVEDALTLPPDFYATAAIKHPNGRDLIVFGSVKGDPKENAGIGYRVYYIDTVDVEFTDEIQVEREVQGCWNVGGTIYTTCNQHFCVFDGTSITPIRKIGISISASPATDLRTHLIWTHHGTVTDQGVLLIPDGNKILAIGHRDTGERIMWHPFDGGDDIDIVHMVFNIGNKYIGIYGYSGARWSGTLKSTILELDQHDGTGKFAANKYRFNQKVWIRRIEIDHETLEADDDFRVGHILEDGTEKEIRAITYAKYGDRYQTRVDCNVYTDVFQPYVEWVAGGVGIKKVTVFYEDGE